MIREQKLYVVAGLSGFSLGACVFSSTATGLIVAAVGLVLAVIIAEVNAK